MTGIEFAVSGYSSHDCSDFASGLIMPDGTAHIFAQAQLGANPSCMCRGGSGELYIGCEMEDRAQIIVLELHKAGIRRVDTFSVPGQGLCHIHCTEQGLVGCCYKTGDVFQVSRKGKLHWHWTPPTGHAHCSAQLKDGTIYWVDLFLDSAFFAKPEDLERGTTPRRIAFPAGSGPRQLLPLDEKHMLVVMETASTLGLLCATDAGWALSCVQSTTALAGENYPGGCCFVPGIGAFVANRGKDTVSLFRVEGQTLVRAGEWPVGGRWPRWISFSGNILACTCQKSNEVILLRWQNQTLHLTGKLPMNSPSCILLDRLSIGGSL